MTNKSLNAPFKVLIADDDDYDIQLSMDCFLENSLPSDVKKVADGWFLLDHLKEIATIKRFQERYPYLVQIDLNMPQVD
jgi:hypothetical protein